MNIVPAVLEGFQVIHSLCSSAYVFATPDFLMLHSNCLFRAYCVVNVIYISISSLYLD